MRTCPKCGNVVHNDNARFCKECGTDLYGKNDGGIWLGDPQKDQTPSVPKQTKSDAQIIKIGIIAVAVIALFLIIFFAFSGSDETQDVSASETEVVSESLETTKPTNSEPVRRETQKEQTQEPTNEVVAESNKVAPQSAEVEKTEDSQKTRLSTALAKGDYKQVQLLANEGYAPAYVPLAKYYLNNNEYDDADRYAKKAKAAGQSGAQAIIKTLENLGYYD